MGADGFGQRVNRGLPIRGGCFGAGGEAHHAGGCPRSEAEGRGDCGDDPRRGGCAGTAGRTGRGFDAGPVEGGDEFSGIGPGNEDRERVPESGRAAAYDFPRRETLAEEGDGGVAVGSALLGDRREISFPRFECRHHAGDAGEVFGTGVLPFFLRSSHVAMDFLPAGHQKKTDAAWSAELVAAAGDPVAIGEPGGGEFTEPLTGIGVEGDVAVATKAGERLPWLEDSALIAGGHHRNSGDGIAPDSVECQGQFFGRNNSLGVDAYFLDAAGEGSADRRVDGGVLEGGEEREGVRGIRTGKVSGEEIVAGGGPRREQDPARVAAAEQIGEAFAAVGEEIAGRRGLAVEARRIVPTAVGDLEPGRAGGGVERRGGVVVEVGHGAAEGMESGGEVSW